MPQTKHSIPLTFRFSNTFPKNEMSWCLYLLLYFFLDLTREMENNSFYKLRREVYSSPEKVDSIIKNNKDLSALQIKKLRTASSYLGRYRKEGVAVIRKAIPQKKVNESVEEIWQSILNLPLVDKEKKVWSELKETFEKKGYWEDCTPEQAEKISEHYPMMGGFGALTLPPAFHLKTQWDIRQSPLLVSVAKNILQSEDILATIDRVSFKAPGQGETEFTHWDSNPWTWQEEKGEGMQGIVSLCKTSFRAVPGTHTEDFRKKFIEKYPRNKRDDQYHVTSDHDPLDLQSKVVEYSLNPGDYIVWSNRLLHEARKNSTQKIRYAYFISYLRRDHIPKAVLNFYSKLGNPEEEYFKDRKESYLTGKNPKVFPSGTEISLFSKSHLMYHPDKLNSFCSTLTKGKQKYTYKSGKKQGQTIMTPVNYNPDGYQPPKLTSLGKKLL